MTETELTGPARHSRMGKLIESRDWSETSLGHRTKWPGILTSALNICLSTDVPTGICWGGSLQLLYNDSFSNLLELNPENSLGQPAGDIFKKHNNIETGLKQILSTGKAESINTDLLLNGSSNIKLTLAVNPLTVNQETVEGLFITASSASDDAEKQPEPKLQKSDNRYQALFENLNEGFCILQMEFNEQQKPVDWEYLETNAAFETHTGLKDVEGKKASQLFNKLENEWLEEYGRVALSGEPVQFDNYSSVLERWYNISAFSVGNPEERKIAVLFQDTTARKEHELSNAYLSAIVENSNDAIISKDLDGIIKSWNKSAERIFGFTAPEAVGRSINIIIPEKRIEEEQKILSLIRKDETIDHFETVRQHKNGSPVDVSLTISPVKNTKGEVVGASKIARNISRQKNAQKKRKLLLREVENERERLSEIFQHAPSFMCVLRGPEHVYERANKLYRKLVGENRDIIGKPVNKALPEAVKQGFTDLLDQVYKSGEPYTGKDVKVQIYPPDGKPETRYLDFVYQPIRQADGSITGIFVQGIDLTERKLTKEKLEDLNETLEERVEKRTRKLISYQNQLRSLAVKLSNAEEQERQRLATELHDNLGQLLTVGKMKIDLLHKKGIPEKISRDVEEVNQIIKDSLSYTRKLMADLKPPPSLDKLDIRTGIRWIAGKMKTHQLDVTVEDDEEPKPLKQDIQVTILQCVRELLFNVVKHTSVNKAVISLKRVGDYLQIIVGDNGEGFAPEGISTTQNGRFGLFNIREHINLLGGSMDIKSEESKGTSVIMSIPLKEKEEVTVAQAKVTEQINQGVERKPVKKMIKVLLADDHQMVREGLRKIIEDQDDILVIAEAPDGEEAIERARETSPDVILMDVNMPKMGGIEATKKILSEMSNVRVIGLSLHDDDGVIQEMSNVGASAYLTKTEAFETLCATIRNVAG